MNDRVLLAGSKLWRGAMELTDFSGEIFAAGLSGRPARTIEALLGQTVRIASCVTLGLEAGDAEERQSIFDEARSAMGALAARVHIAAANGVVTPEFALGVRRRLRALVDALDLERYRSRRRAVRTGAA